MIRLMTSINYYAVTSIYHFHVSSVERGMAVVAHFPVAYVSHNCANLGTRQETIKTRNGEWALKGV